MIIMIIKLGKDHASLPIMCVIHMQAFANSMCAQLRMPLCVFVCACMSLSLSVSLYLCYLIDLAPLSTRCGPWAMSSYWKKKETTFVGHSVLKSGCMVDNKLAPSCLPLQMLRLGFNCGTWVGKQQHYRQNSNAHVSGRVVNSSHNTSVYTVDTEPATFAPLPCSHWIRIWHKFCTYKISKCHCSRS